MSGRAYILTVKKMKGLLQKKKVILSLCLTLAGAFIAIRFNDVCARGIGNGIRFCTDVLVPSLFLFMVLTAYCIKSGAAAALCRPFGWLGRMMGLPREAATAVLTAMIGGYPIGAGCAAMLYEQGQLSASEAAKTACVAVAAGPGFIINFVGRAVLQNRQAADILLIAQITAVLLTGCAIGRLVPCSPPPARRRIGSSGGGALTEAVRAAADATFTMCATVVLFSAVIEVLTAVADPRAADIAAAFLEITAGCSRLSARVPLTVTAFFIGFGGIAVHCQILASVRELPVNRPLFFLTRVAQGIICAGATYILLIITPMESAVFSSAAPPLSAGRSATYAGSGALILAALCFIGSVSSRMRRLKQCAE